MRCIQCGGDAYALSTRERDSAYVYRRRECPMCGTRFATYEFTDDVVQQIVMLLGGRQEMIAQVREQLPRFYSSDKKFGRKEKKT